jgi:Fe-S-cluster containining protein
MLMASYEEWSKDTVQACNQCGKCCTKYGGGGLVATPSEIEWWRTFRPRIAEYARDGEIWIDPATGKRALRCPWLREVPNQNKYTCAIYYDRPDDCKHYPVTIDQMVADDCEMLEARDLANPDQAQRKLDLIMTDSRPAYR